MKFKKCLLLAVLLNTIIVGCQSQTKDEYNNGNVLNNLKNDTLAFYDIKKLSGFIDTTLITRFYPEILKFKKDDSIHPHRKTDIVFVGSSTIRKWNTLAADMKYLKVLNRGFGGSTVPEAIYFANNLIFKHHPKAIVFYEGDNDITYKNANPENIFNSYLLFCQYVHKKMPNLKIFILSVKPSIARKNLWIEMQKLNKLLYDFCKTTYYCEYIDITKVMLHQNNEMRKDIYIKDSLHMNSAGYRLWSAIIFPILNKNYGKF